MKDWSWAVVGLLHLAVFLRIGGAVELGGNQRTERISGATIFGFSNDLFSIYETFPFPFPSPSPSPPNYFLS